ncbi:carboxylesterase/lipase family protein [Gilvimarinus sp. F26214L]|uniref:carboxylesterase/lipase family protein n=1 Tax=Gilvimarinus sp. DZF01 TaxID=3461371 RepID=UPI004045EBBA
MKKRLLIALLFGLSHSLWAEPAVVDTPQGKLQGEVSEDGVRSFKAIPYALPPTGERRWKPAEPAPAWRGVRMADAFAPNCVQLPYPEGSFFSRPSPPASEDCLYLNVWSAANEGEKRPVMVWIHGGALTRGSGAIDTYNGAALAKKGVVVVTINYRLGMLGYFSHPQLSAESPHGSSGNYGTTDQVQALKWVQDNIAAFGGDPDQVTIFGESAGSWSVNHLVASPLAKGLFHRAIGQSGAVLEVMPELKTSRIDQPSAEQRGEALAEAILHKDHKSPIEALRALPAAELMARSEEHGHLSRAVVDGWVFPEQIYSIMAQGKQNPVPVLVGFNADEGTTLGAGARAARDAETYQRTVKARYAEFAGDYLQLYPADDLLRSTLDAFRDSFVTWPMQTWAMFTANVAQPAYLYYFTHRPAGPLKEQLGAYHAAEIQYVFNNVRENDTRERELGDVMSDYWVAFAKDGDPNAAKSDHPDWKPYTKERRHYMEFNNESGAAAVPAENLLPGIWEFYEKLNASLRGG